ncbi:S41 family peptidase [Confluentibacter sediminis]|uniref:S41 family peptidase n=1 Tax=Confluentibacter sediminis TaxID=2219045 RepID=UPI0013A701D3|nr:S41 family peptidase [Confluentibacter sediminis]
MKIIILSSLILLISCKTENKKPEFKEDYSLSKQEMLQDFEMFESIYEKANAGLYKYRSKSEIDSVFRKNKAEIKDHVSYREFYNILWNVIDYTGSCHNELTYPDSLDNHLSKQKIFFPIPLKYLENKIYTNLDYKNIPTGSEIISINNMSADQFLTSLGKYVSTDGFNKTGKNIKIETDWLPFYIYLAMGKQNQFEIEYKTINSDIIKKSSIISVPYKDFYANYNKRHSKEFEHTISKDYAYKLLDSINTGLLEVHTFGMGGPDTDGHKKYAVFLDSVFTTLKTKKVKNLIVDVRGNGGGNDPNDILLYSYLAQREFRENKTAFTIFQDIPFPKYYIDDDIDELPGELKEEHSIYKHGKYYQNESFNKIWKPNTNAFQGTIILLIDPYVASAGSLFASLVKSDENTIVIGEETLGGYYGHTGHIPVTYKLPNSKLKLSFSIVDIEQDVKELSDEKFGDGIRPDFKVVQSHKDFMSNKDTQMNFAMERIKKL